MTQTRIAKAVAALILSSIAGLAAASGTQQIDVSATVSTVCKFTTGSAIAMTFAAIDPSSAGPATKAVDVPFQCTKGTSDTSVTVTAGGSSLVNGSDTMAYSVTVGTIPSGTGFSGSAAATKVTVTGSIPATSYADAKALTYTDTVTLTINH
jgi:hypothetical protein